MHIKPFLNRLTLAIVLWFHLSIAAAQVSLFALPPERVSRTADAVVISGAGQTLTYVAGIGWVPAFDSLSEPVITDTAVYAPAAVFELLGLGSARIAAVRFGGSGTVRVVLDLEAVDMTQFQGLEQTGRTEPGQTLQVHLPNLLIPLALPDAANGIDLELYRDAAGVTLELSGPALAYKVFSLENPNRLVVDLTPLAFADVVPEVRAIASGVTYRRFASPTEIGSSGVHVLEIAPGLGEFKVVGQGKHAMKVSELASGALAAINAGYFDTRSFDAIGLLKVDDGLLSLPSRNRASIGFGAGAPLMARVQAQVNVRISNHVYQTENANSEISPAASRTVHTQAGAFVGSPAHGVITVQRGRVLDNKIGPRAVPEDGFALVYTPEQRDLARVNPGELAALDIKFDPAPFASARYAVEAGPLLLKEGHVVYAPEQEQFTPGTPIIDGYTQQAAIGVRADGTLLLVAGDNMIAKDLITLFVALGARDAMRLDSGSSTTLYAAGEVFNRSRERKVVSAIVYVPY